jgi:plastocyanin
MNRYRLIGLPLALAGILAACSPSASAPSAEPTETPHTMSSSSAAPTPSGTEEASESAEPTATPHDMDGMGGSGETVAIEIEGFAFSPAELTISVGTEVTVTNLDSAPHTFTAGSDADPQPDVFDSGLLQQGESFTFVFDEPGTFAYYCDRHPPMQGEITVTE